MSAQEKIPPHSIEAEQHIIGSVMIEPDSILKISDIVQPEDFYRSAHKTIFSACLDIYRHDELNLVSLSEYLKSGGALEACGGVSYIAAVVEGTPTTANIAYYARLVKKKAIQRRIQQWSADIREDIANGNADDLPAFFSGMEKAIIDMAQPLQTKRMPDVASILESIRTRWQEEKSGIRKFISTDDKFSAVIPRYVPGHLWIIGGYTSVGKSTLLAQMIADVCAEGAKTIVFSLEDACEDKIIKLLANLAYCGQTRLMTGDVEEPYMQKKLLDAEKTLRKWGLVVYDDVYNVDAMRLKIKKHKLQGGADVVCVDFIQNLSGAGTLYERISDGIVKLQQMAKELEVTMLFASQVNNEAMRSNNEVIGLKGAGELAASADIVLWLKRVKGEGNEKYLDVEIKKNRPFGKTGIAPLMFNEIWSKVLRRGF